jgi:GTP-binding protein
MAPSPRPTRQSRSSQAKGKHTSGLRRKLTPTISPQLEASLPKVAIVGRPNVGKSTFINRLCGQRLAIVDDQPGVTRDRCYYTTFWRNQPIRLVDTGGVHWEPSDPFAQLINEQVQATLHEADIVLLLVDAQTGLTDLDEQVAKWVRKANKPTLVVVNKVDTMADAVATSEFYALGMGEPKPVSALHGSASVGDVLDEVLTLLHGGFDTRTPKKRFKTTGVVSSRAMARRGDADGDDDLPELPAAPADPMAALGGRPLHLALVGRPNVGKSSLLNALLGEERSLVSPLAGTTRDAIDGLLEHNGQGYRMLDTAGIRRKSKVDFGVELFSVDRAVRTLRKADVSILLLDAEEGITEQDKRIAQKVLEAGKALVVAINKWDAIEDKDTSSTVRYQKKLLADVPSLNFASMVFISAKTGQRITKLLDKAKDAYINSQRRIGTHTLNQLLAEATSQHPIPLMRSRQARLLYATQVKAGPPTFVLFVNNKALLREAYMRYLERFLRERVELTGTPVKFVLRNRAETKTPSKRQTPRTRSKGRQTEGVKS